jgi:hypothetical protein
MNVYVFYFILWIFTCSAFAAINPAFNGDYRTSAEIFDTGSVAVVHVTMSASDLSDMLSDVWSDEYKYCNIVFSNRFIAEVVTNVGIRLRGNTSRTATRKSYKLSFNAFSPGKTFHGLRKINFNGEHNDPSIMRSALCWSRFQSMRMPASRTGYALLYINNTLFGLFVNVEEIDEEFLQARFGSAAGNLFKCLYKGEPAELTYRSDGRYDLVGGGETYQLRTNEESNDFSDLAYFIDKLNNTHDTNFATEVESILNVELFVRWLAINTLCGSWDDYRYLANNYFLYNDQVENRFCFIPYDYDNTLGVDWIQRNWATRDLNDWDRHNHPRPLSKRILAVPRWRRMYNQYLADFSAGPFSTGSMTYAAVSLKDFIQSAAELSYAHVAQDWGFTINDFNASLSTPATYDPYTGGGGGDHVTYGILPYAATRNASLPSQLDSMIICLNEVAVSNTSGITDEDGRSVPWLELYNPSFNTVSLSGLYLTDSMTAPHTWPLPNTNVPARGYILLWLDGHPERGDMHAPFTVSTNATLHLVLGSDEIDRLAIPSIAPQYSYGRYIDWHNHERPFAVPTPGEENRLAPLPAPDILVNEFLADNDTIITNPVDGNFDDWLELVNPGTEPVQLRGTFISDSSAQPLKWYIIEPVELAPGAHLIIWADSHPEYGNLHAAFRLSRSGEEIQVTGSGSNTPVDYILYGLQVGDVSRGRFPDASGGPSNMTAFIPMDPTPGNVNVPEPGVVMFILLVAFPGLKLIHRRREAAGV